MIVLILLRISSMKGMTSPTCTWTKCLRHFCEILMNVSHAMSWTPSWVSAQKIRRVILNHAISQTKCFPLSLKHIAIHTSDPVGNSPCMNSKSLLTTVFKNFQCARRNRGYWPTTYMMFEAMIALLSLPRFCSHNPSRSCLGERDKETLVLKQTA